MHLIQKEFIQLKTKKFRILVYIKRLVVGGPSGTVVAIAAKRVGAVNIVLIEQFVYQGDMATDG